jgi:hypothetical protein
MGTDPCKTLFLASEIDMKNAFQLFIQHCYIALEDDLHHLYGCGLSTK